MLKKNEFVWLKQKKKSGEMQKPVNEIITTSEKGKEDTVTSNDFPSLLLRASERNRKIIEH